MTVWDLVSIHEVAKLRGSLGEFTGVCFSPDVRRILASDNQGVVWLWDLEKAGFR